MQFGTVSAGANCRVQDRPTVYVGPNPARGLAGRSGALGAPLALDGTRAAPPVGQAEKTAGDDRLMCEGAEFRRLPFT